MRTLIIVVLVVLVIVLLVSLGKGKDAGQNDQPTCPNQFSLRPESIIGNVATTNYFKNGDKYYSQTSGSALGGSVQLPPKEITETVFVDACKKFIESQPK